MATEVIFGFTNRTAQATGLITGKKLGMYTNYDAKEFTSNSTLLRNATCPIDRDELVSIRTKDLPRIDNDLNIEKVSPIKGGIEYSIQTQTVATVKDDVTGLSYQEPVVITTTIRHHKNACLTGSIISQLLERNVSAFYQDDGTERFSRLMTGCEAPKAD